MAEMQRLIDEEKNDKADDAGMTKYGNDQDIKAENNNVS